ncbi:MAG: nitroreductase [Parvularculaceae bacterium]|nr:nitroreductase [Parvularculaceae bacterium]
MPAPSVQQSTLNYLATRRSLTAAQMQGPGPSADETAALLRMAARVPDHRRVHPFRFITFEGEARAAFGEVLAGAFAASNAEAGDDVLALERGRFTRAPLVVAVISSVNKEHKTPEWEQVLTAGAVAQNLVIASGAAGYAAQWLTEWYAFDAQVAEAMKLGPDERVAGFVYIGTAAAQPKERARMDAKELTSAWTG